MAVDVKICGLKNHQAVEAAVEGGARYLGFVFYPPSPRAVTPKAAFALGRSVPADRLRVGVMVDPDDLLVDQVLEALDVIQLHGKETPERVNAIKARTGKTVIKALRLGDADGLQPLDGYAEVADMILFDAKPPSTPDSLPGGNGLSFDWRLLDGLALDRPWLLSGGLNVDNLEDAVRLCHAQTVDVSSGVETEPGVKDLDKIRTFLRHAADLTPTS
ncbi:MAG: phosphoribosylanthranilate isomerase [Alphaproteobacteria bacterium]|nr:phosphoribosylanthranilate isomerase [Alphaproteobacteria bacterium]